jgi:hypothetical protein
MNIDIYTQRVKYPKLPDDFNHQDGNKFHSSYEYAKTFSNYHFDKWQTDLEGQWFHRLGRFIGDWSEILPNILEQSQQLTWDQSTSQNLRPGFKDGASPMQQQEKYDRQQHGLEDVDQTNLVLENTLKNYPIIEKMVDFWSLEKVTYRIHVQWPGQAFGMHIDKLWHRNPSDPSRIIRIVVNLADYEPGQVMCYGNAVLTGWHAGDIHMFDTLNVPHGTMNLSVHPRPNLVITGLRTSITDQKLSSAEPNSRYTL